jgi:hypothetical protein
MDLHFVLILILSKQNGSLLKEKAYKDPLLNKLIFVVCAHRTRPRSGTAYFRNSLHKSLALTFSRWAFRLHILLVYLFVPRINSNCFTKS